MQLIPKIRERRMEVHLTQVQLAKKLGIEPSHLSALEHGKHFPELPFAFEIAKAIGCKVDNLYEYSE